MKKFSRVAFLILLLFSFRVSDAAADGLFPDEQPVQKAEEPSKPEVAPEEGPQEPEEKAATAEPVPARPAPIVTPQPKPNEQRDFWSIFSKGTILFEPKPAGNVIASKDQREMFGLGDTLYLTSFREDFVPQKEWVVFRKIKNVNHPKTGKYLGDLIDLVGMVKVLESDKKLATAEVIKSKGPIFANDGIAPIESLFDLSAPARKPLLQKEATIVELRDHRRNSGEHDIVYLDRGKEDGVLTGDEFEVIHHGRNVGISTGSMIQLPERKVGRVVILSTQDHTSTAQILKSAEPISVGDPLLYLSKGK